MDKEIEKQFKIWREKAVEDEDVVRELGEIAADGASMADAFFKTLSFGTGGLRGVIGAGTNRMNIYTVAKASQGLADYLNRNSKEPSVVIGYDSRIKSDLFSRTAASVFAANGIRVHIWPALTPVPTVSFAVRYLHADAGVMITASHNPAKYNGYKVYGADGCQITTEAAAAIQKEIEKLDIFSDVKMFSSKENKARNFLSRENQGKTFTSKENQIRTFSGNERQAGKDAFDIFMEKGIISYVPDEVLTAFISEIKKQSVLFGDGADRDVAIVYSPLNGSGLVPVTRVLKETGYTNITLVKEQEQPDGHFPTCPYPNPEIREAMELGMKYARECHADLLLATDPDCDRVGIAVRDEAGEYVLLSGNETGLLLLDYICSQRAKHGKMPRIRS